jgi:hypothetical protein
MEEDARGWRRMHNEELLSLFASPTVRAIKSMKIRWAGHVARLGEMLNAHNWGELKLRDHM